MNSNEIDGAEETADHVYNVFATVFLSFSLFPSPPDFPAASQAPLVALVVITIKMRYNLNESSGAEGTADQAMPPPPPFLSPLTLSTPALLGEVQ